MEHKFKEEIDEVINILEPVINNYSEYREMLLQLFENKSYRQFLSFISINDERDIYINLLAEVPQHARIEVMCGLRYMQAFFEKVNRKDLALHFKEAIEIIRESSILLDGNDNAYRKLPYKEFIYMCDCYARPTVVLSVTGRVLPSLFRYIANATENKKTAEKFFQAVEEALISYNKKETTEANITKKLKLASVGLSQQDKKKIKGAIKLGAIAYNTFCCQALADTLSLVSNYLRIVFSQVSEISVIQSV